MILKNLLGGAVVGAALLLAGTAASTSAMAVTIGFSQVGDEGDWRPAWTKDMQEEAKAAGIPVFTADRDVDVKDKSLFVTRISADFNLEGRLAGAWLAQASKGNCNIVELQGTTGAAPAIERKKGFEAIISNFPGMKIVKTQSGDFTTEGGKKVMEAFIKSTDNLKDICGVFAHNDNMQFGAIQAMKEAGLKPGVDFKMVSVDYVPAMKTALAAGDANASVELRSAIGKYIYPVVLQYLKDKKELPKWIVIPGDLHTAATPQN